MNWVAASLGSAAVFGVVSVLDKRILSFQTVELPPFYLVVGLLNVLIGAAIAAVVPWGDGVSGGALLAAILAGLLWGVGLLLFFYGVQRLEVSRVVPIFHTFPVFVAIMAVFLLDEALGAIHWLAILMIVVGAALVTVERQGEWLRRNALLDYAAVLLASVIVAGGNVATKYALEEISVWNAMALRASFLGLALVLPAVHPQALSRVKGFLANRPALGLTLVTEGALAPLGTLLGILALGLGQVSPASAIMATRPLFVLVISAALSTRALHLLDEPLNRNTLPLKLLSTTLIVGGVTILSLV